MSDIKLKYFYGKHEFFNAFSIPYIILILHLRIKLNL